MRKADLILYAAWGDPPTEWLKVRALGYDAAKAVTRVWRAGNAWLYTVEEMREEWPEVYRRMRSDRPMTIREAIRRKGSAG